MNEQHPNAPHALSPEDQALVEEAGRAESDAANAATAQYLQGRVVELRVEVIRLSRRVAELEARHDAGPQGAPVTT